MFIFAFCHICQARLSLLLLKVRGACHAAHAACLRRRLLSIFHAFAAPPRAGVARGGVDGRARMTRYAARLRASTYARRFAICYR